MVQCIMPACNLPIPYSLGLVGYSYGIDVAESAGHTLDLYALAVSTYHIQ